MTGRGRPMKYVPFIKALVVDRLYTPATVVKTGEDHGLFQRDEFLESDARSKVRNAMNRFATCHFPKEADGFVKVKGHPPFKGWYGWRWKAAVPKWHFTEEERLAIQKEQKRSENGALASSFLLWLGEKAQIYTKTKRGRWALGTVLLVTMLGMGAFVSLQVEGLRIFREQGPRAALAYFTSVNLKRGDHVLTFGKAWSKYVVGDFHQAEEDCYQLIQDRRTPPSVIAKSFYLLGRIQARTGHMEEALENYHKALDLFDGLGFNGNLYQTYCALAEISMAKGNLEEADYYLELALSYHNATEKNIGGYYHLQAELAFLRDDYELALDQSHLSYQAYQTGNMLNNTSDALIDIGFYSILTGDFDNGFERTMAAQEILNKTGDSDKLHYSFINLILLRRCEGGSHAYLEKSVLTRIRESGDGKLKRLFEFVMGFDCALLGRRPDQGGEGSDEPPNPQ